jgi:hypothetical protein
MARELEGKVAAATGAAAARKGQGRLTLLISHSVLI